MTFDLKSAELLYKTAGEMGLRPKWLNDFGLFEIIVKGKKHYIFHSYSILNSQLGMQLSRHKHLTRNIIENNSLHNIPYVRPKSKKELEVFIAKHKKVIMKPVFGSRADGVRIIKNITELSNLDPAEFIFEKFIEGIEFRYLVLNNEVLAVHERSNRGEIYNTSAHKRFSYPTHKWDKQLVKTSIQIASIMDLKFAAVDFIIDKNNKPYILEVNSAPGLYKFQYPANGPSIEIAKMFLEQTINKIDEKTDS